MLRLRQLFRGALLNVPMRFAALVTAKMEPAVLGESPLHIARRSRRPALRRDLPVVNLLVLRVVQSDTRHPPAP